MRAVWITRYGPPEVLEVKEAEDPEPKKGEVRIRVAASGINFADVSARVGLYPDAPPAPFVVGYEVAGTVDAVGEGVAEFQAGDRVLAMTRFGGYADTVCVPEDQALQIPEEMSFAEGAAIPVNYLTAYHILFEISRLQPKSRVLVHMAAGGVGLAAIQLLQLVPEVVIFGTSSAKKHDLLREKGVQYPIDYRTLDYAEEVRRITDGEGVDLVMDALGGADWKTGYELLRPAGQLVAFGFANAVQGKRRNLFKVIRQWFRMPRFNPLKLMDHNRGVAGVNLGRLWDQRELLNREMTAILEHYEAGLVRPHVDSTFPLEEAARAHHYIQDRKNVGKVVLVAEDAESD